MLYIKKSAFTLIELVFVIVILGILASVAIPKFSSINTSSTIAKGKADVATIRSAIVSERQTQLIKGTYSYIPALSNSTTTLFMGDGTRTLLMYGITAGTTSGKWSRGAHDALTDVYTFKVGTSSNTFTYTVADGTFKCTLGTECSNLTD